MTNAMIQDGKLRLAFLFVLGNNTGYRISDLLRVKYEDIRNREEIVLTEQKTGKQRKISINKKVNVTIHFSLLVILLKVTGILISLANPIRAMPRG